MSHSAVLKLSRSDRDDFVEAREQRLLLQNVTWKQYVALRKLFNHVAGLRMTYLEGRLEIMSPSEEHERIKTMTGRLLEAYAEEWDIPLNGYGSATYRKKAKERGLEPDECYYVGPPKRVPDLAIEVVISSGGIDRLSVYEGLGVTEVWIFHASRFQIYRLGPKGYSVRSHSAFLPGLDVELLARYVRRQDQTAAVKAFRLAVRRR